MQSGLCDINIGAVDIAQLALPALQARPQKRRFTEIEDSEEENPDSDELYGWVEDDAVAAEGLLVDDEVSAEYTSPAGGKLPAESCTMDVPERPSKKVAQ